MYIIYHVYNSYARHYFSLNYITESNYTKIDENTGLDWEGKHLYSELTWFGYYPNANKETLKVINETYGTAFDENMDFSKFSNGVNPEEASVFISIGRKLKTLYYGNERYASGSYDDETLPVPVFERQYEHKIYLYLTDKKYHIMGEPELIGMYDDIFNELGEIPYEEEERKWW